MVETIAIHGSGGEVQAPFGVAGYFIRGKRQTIVVTKVSQDLDTPLVIREALVGLQVSCIFTKQQIGKNFPEIPEGSLLAYSQEVIAVLCGAGKQAAAQALQKVSSAPLDMYVFEPEIFELVKE